MKHSNCDEIVKQAVDYAKFYLNQPCNFCKEQSYCNVIYQGTCDVWRKLKAKLYINIQELEKTNERNS